MAKKLIQDIIVKDKKNIRPIQKEMREPIAPRVQEPVQKPTEESPRIFFPEKKKFFEEDFEENDEPRRAAKKSHLFLWIISIIALAAVLFTCSLVFATATVTITPKKEPIILNNTYTISATSSVRGLHYQVLSLQKTVSQSLPTNGEQNVEVQGTGRAIIYNDYSTKSQRLINNTQLETSDGVIYRTKSSVTIPGMTTVKGVKVPGSVEVAIIADLPGPQYDMKVSDLKGDFTIPGFEGSAKYTGFYARLASDVTGGFIGTAKTVDPNVLSVGRQTLINTLTTDLIAEAYATISPEQTIIKNNYFIETSDLPDTPTDSSYTITEQVNLYAIVFNTNQLATFIAKNTSSDYDGTSSISILWNNDISATSTGETVTPWLENSLSMQISGDADIVWSYDTAAILNEIKGQDKSVLQNILNEDKSSITEIDATIRPVWKSTFPENPEKINIVNSVLDTQSQ